MWHFRYSFGYDAFKGNGFGTEADTRQNNLFAYKWLNINLSGNALHKKILQYQGG